MRRYTTPTVTVTVEGVDITGCDVYVTIAQGQHAATFENAPMELVDSDTAISVDMSQCETAGFRPGLAKVQVNWIDEYGKRNALQEGAIAIDGNLLDRVLP